MYSIIIGMAKQYMNVDAMRHARSRRGGVLCSDFPRSTRRHQASEIDPHQSKSRSQQGKGFKPPLGAFCKGPFPLVACTSPEDRRRDSVHSTSSRSGVRFSVPLSALGEMVRSRKLTPQYSSNSERLRCCERLKQVSTPVALAHPKFERCVCTCPSP